MAIIVDPDFLDRDQIVFSTVAQRLSLRDVGNVVTSALDKRTTGDTTTGSLVFSDSGAEFVTWGVSPGQVLTIYTKNDAGHYVIDAVGSETVLTAALALPDVTAFTGSGGVTYSVHSASGGSAVDGATEQAVYSFAKEEWRVDTETFGGDNLIRHPFPFEAITREQMEIGGGTAHANWNWFNEYTRKKVRTGGWAKKNTAAVTLEQWTGVVTLGTLDTDAQVYYQPLSASATPVDFTFLGPVNEAVKVFESGSVDSDTRQFLKLFVRKKGRTYAQSAISDIGVSSIETIVNRFPLTHQTDPAIVATDGALLGTSPFRNQNTLTNGTDGSKSASQTTFTSAGSTFQSDGVQPGDALTITGGQEEGTYTIESVDSETQLTIASDADFTTWSDTESSLTFAATTTDIIRNRSKDLTIQNINDSTGAVTSSTGGFDAALVSAGDLIHITEDNNYFSGIYPVLSRPSDTILTVDTTDQVFPSAPSGTLDFKVTEPGMYLQFKQELLNTSSAGTVTFSSLGYVTRSLGNWGSDGISTGSILVVANSTDNDGEFTVDESVSGDVVSVVPTDTLSDESTTSANIHGYNPFKRVVNGVTYGFKWKVTGNNTILSNIYQFIQHQLRQSTDIDNGVSSSRGDVTDLLMSYASPTATTFDMFIDDLDNADVNNVTFRDATSATRTEKFVAAGSISFNDNLQNDASAVYAMFFTNDDAGTNLGRDYGTPESITVRDNDGTEISGSIGGSPTVSFSYDYDGNTQRGVGSAGTNAPVTVVAIGLNTAQFVLFQGTIERSKSNNFALVAALERNYSNPA